MKKSTWQTLGALGIAAVVGSAAIIGLNAWDARQTTAESIPAPVVVSNFEVNGFAEAPEKPAPVVVEAAPEAVVEEPVPEAPDYGQPVPWIEDPNPNNTEGGYWDTTQCPSGSAYQAPDGNQYCS